GGGRAAVLRAIEDAGEHDQAGDRLEPEGERQEHRDGGDRPDAGEHADQRTDQRADEREQEVRGRHRDAQSRGEVVEELHPPTGQSGIVKSSPRMKIAHDSTVSTIAAATASHTLMPGATSAPTPTRSAIESASPSCSIASANATRLKVTTTTGI